MESKQSEENLDFDPDIGTVTEDQKVKYIKMAEELHNILEGEKSKLQTKNREEPLIKFVLGHSKKERQIIRKFYKFIFML